MLSSFCCRYFYVGAVNVSVERLIVNRLLYMLCTQLLKFASTHTRVKNSSQPATDAAQHFVI